MWNPIKKKFQRRCTCRLAINISTDSKEWISSKLNCFRWLLKDACEHSHEPLVPRRNGVSKLVS